MIPDDLVDKYLKSLFGRSDPGDMLHHLLIAAADPASHTALGIPNPDALEVSVYGIVPGPGDVDRFIEQTITTAISQHRKAGRTIYFAGLTLEAHAVADDGNELTENLARRLGADGKLEEHPAAIELTQLYAACRDGRRWTGHHFLTGPKAGTVQGPDVHVGALGADESGRRKWLIRLAAGL